MRRCGIAALGIVPASEDCPRHHYSGARESSQRIARQLLLEIITRRHTLLLCNETLYELARVLRYPRMQALHGLTEARIYDYIGLLREVSELVIPNPVFSIPIRDINDIVVIQTAVIGEADVICTKDEDFYESGITLFLTRLAARGKNRSLTVAAL